MPSPQTRFAVLLFTDIVGSAGLKMRHGVPAYREALDVHNRHFEALASASPGFRVLQNMGDGYFAEAPGVAEAVRLALLFQQAMREAPWGEVVLSTRVGIHAGEVAVVDSAGGSGIVSPAADLAARVTDLGLGGQILLTRLPFDEARHFIRDHPAVEGRQMPTLTWLAHGPYRVKGRDEPLEIFEVGADGLAPLSPPPDGEKATRAIRPGEEETLGWRPAAGLEIPGRTGWHLLDRLGEGGFGEVWAGEHTKLRQRRAFKFCFDEERLRALKREVTLVRLLRSALGDRDDIVRIHEIKLDEPPFYLESDLAPHGNLLQWAARQGGLENIPLETRIALVAHTATALAAAHSLGVLHKDIKPTNILIFDGPDGEPRPRLVDFGIGTLAEPEVLARFGMTGAGFTRPTIAHSTGTPTYSPPELLAGKPYTIQGDMFGLGVLLYQLVTAKAHEPLATGWERDVEDPLLREDIALCVDGDPARRLASAAELAGRLESLAQRRAEIAERERLARAEVERIEAEANAAATRASLARSRKLTAAFATFAALAICGGVFALMMQREATRQRDRATVERNHATAQEAKANQQVLDAARNAWRAARQSLDRGDTMVGLGRLAEALRYNAALPEPLRLPGIGIDAGSCLLQLPTLPPLPVGDPMRHEDRVYGASFSPDGKRVVTASDDNMARVWDAATGKPVGEAMRHGDIVNRASFSPDGTCVVTASSDKSARVWDAVSGKPVGEPMRHESKVWSASFSPDGSRVVTASPGKVQIWDAASGKPIGEAMQHGHFEVEASFSPDGTRVVTASGDKTARVWDAATGESVTGSMQHEDSVTSACFSPDGTRVVTASDRTARLWDADTGVPVGEVMRHRQYIFTASFSPDGNRVVTASNDGRARVWDAATGRPVGDLMWHDANVISASFSPDGTRVVTASGDGTARIWNAATDKVVGGLMRHEEGVWSAGFSPDGTRVVTASADKTARVWDALTGKPVGDAMWHGGVACSASFSPDGSRVVTASEDRTAQVWDAATGKPVINPMWHEDVVGSASFSPDGTRVVTASFDSTARVWDAATGKLVGEPIRHEDKVRRSSFSLDGTRVVTASYDNTARVWDVVSSKPVGEAMRHEGGVISAYFSPDGTRVVTASFDKTARVWDAATGMPVGEAMRHEHDLISASFSPDGTRVVTASKGGTARVWDAATGRPVGDKISHEDVVGSASFSPDGTRVVTASDDKTARVWDAVSGKPVGEPMRHESRVWSASFSPDGSRVVTASFDGTARVWEQWQASDAPPTAELFEAATNYKVNAEGVMVPVGTDDRVSLIKQSLAQPTDGSAVQRILHWRFGNPRTRTISPNSVVTVPEHVEREIGWVIEHPEEDNVAAILRDAYELDPGHPLIQIALAAVETNGPTPTNGVEDGPLRAEFLREYGLKRLPEDARICAKAAEMLNLQDDPKRAVVAAEKALSLDPNNDAALREKARAEKALSLLQRPPESGAKPGVEAAEGRQRPVPGGRVEQKHFQPWHGPDATPGETLEGL